MRRFLAHRAALTLVGMALGYVLIGDPANVADIGRILISGMLIAMVGMGFPAATSEAPISGPRDGHFWLITSWALLVAASIWRLSEAAHRPELHISTIVAGFASACGLIGIWIASLRR